MQPEHSKGKLTRRYLGLTIVLAVIMLVTKGYVVLTAIGLVAVLVVVFARSGRSRNRVITLTRTGAHIRGA